MYAGPPNDPKVVAGVSSFPESGVSLCDGPVRASTSSCQLLSQPFIMSLGLCGEGALVK